MVLETLVDIALSRHGLGTEPLPILLAGKVDCPVLMVIIRGEFSHAQDLQLAVLLQGLNVVLQTVYGATLVGCWRLLGLKEKTS